MKLTWLLVLPTFANLFRSFAETLPTPNLDVAHIADPRRGASVNDKTVPVVGFYGSHHNQLGNSKVDDACNATFLGNWWTPARLDNFAPPAYTSSPHSFICSEAAYWACQWWDHASEFEGLNGQQVFEHALKLNATTSPDPHWGGFGSQWHMMIAILRAKFLPGSPIAAALLSTGDAYLVEHQEGYDSDDTWSDFCDGTGSNWLGMNLMRVRDELAGFSSHTHGSWTEFIDAAYDKFSGKALPGQVAWLRSVRSAAAALNTALPYKCPDKTSFQV